jgi:hypothetical protein
MKMYEWLIIGGGIQGCTMATYLLRNRKTSIENMAIIDPHHKPLSTWLRCTSTLELLESEQEILTGSIVLATGFHSTVPGIEWLQSVVHSEGLSCAKCGYPIVSPNTLEWGPNLFVIGALAELEIGPVSRNIAGARRGAERILRVN